MFSHWDVINVDPNAIITEEEIEEFGEDYVRENLAKNYINKVRKRKGLQVDTQLVHQAEKQRNLTKMR